jgi:type VI secretion system protein ImpL
VPIKTLLLILLLCLCLVWVVAFQFHAGPEFLPFGLWWTIVVLIVALSVVVGVHIFRWWRQWRAEAASRPAATAKAAPTVHEDDAALMALIAEANATLAKAPNYAGKSGKSPLSGLALYLLIGPEGSGKTSTFLSSGVEPQLLAGENGKLPGAATRLCNIWLAKNAVFVEFSGRLFNGDLSRWGQLLNVLRGRPSTPLWRRLWREPDAGLTLRGVIGFCDVQELTGAAADPQRLERECRGWQERLRAIADVFGVEFLVYQVFTKADKIPFFPDYFGRIPESEVNQVLGCTLPIFTLETLRPGEVFAEVQAKRLTSSFRPLYQSLAERRLASLAHEPNSARRPAIYEFPRELKRIRSPLVQFLNDVFRPNPLRPNPLLRGYYLTAVSEVEAVAADPDLGRGDWTSPNLGMETTRMFRGDATQIFKPEDSNRKPNAVARKGRGLRSMFASDLFHQVVLLDQLVPRAVPVDARLQRYRRAAFAGVCGLCALLCVAFTVSWAQNRGLLRDVADAANANMQTRERARVGLATVGELRAMERLREQVERLQTGEGLSYRWTLYQGNAILGAAKDAYFKSFQRLLLTDLNSSILRQLQKLPDAPGPNDPDEPAYNLLKTHLMISSGVCKLEPPLVSRVLTEVEHSQLAFDHDREWLSLADRQIGFYASALSDGNPCHLTEDVEVTNHARQYLQKIKGVDRIYQAILADAEKTLTKSQRLEETAPNYKQVLNGPAEVRAVFSPAGWLSVQKESKTATGGTGESCVIGNPSGLVTELRQDAVVAQAIQQRFIREYIDQWQKFVAGFSVIPYKTSADAAQKLDILASHNSPLLAMLAMTSNQTNFPAASESGLSKIPVAGSILGKAEKATKKLESLQTNTTDVLSAADITSAFQPVQWVEPPGSDKWVVDKNSAYVTALAQLGHSMQDIAHSDKPDPTLNQAATQNYGKAMDAAKQLESGFRPVGVGALDRDVQRILEEPIEYTRRIIGDDGDDRKKTNAALQKLCGQVGNLKYPFQTKSSADTSLGDLKAAFVPAEGAIWKFQSSALAEFTILDGGVWKQNPASQKLKASPELLEFLNRAEQIKKTFFPEGKTDPYLTYTLRPVLADPSQVIKLQIDGQSHEFSDGVGKIQHTFHWPVEPAQGAVAQSGTSKFSATFSAQSGVWSVFRMFADAEPRELLQKTLVWKRTKGASGVSGPMDPPVTLELVNFPSNVDIFNPKFFGDLKCPSKATQ